jgi:hypothetical protein
MDKAPDVDGGVKQFCLVGVRRCPSEGDEGW